MEFYSLNIKGYKADLPILPLPSGIKIAFFNLHGNTQMTEHCGKELAKLVGDCDVLLTAESKGLQLTHVVARELGPPYYAVARKSQKLYMQDGLDVVISSSITTGKEQHLYLSKFDADLLKGKKLGFGCVDSAVNAVDDKDEVKALVERGIAAVGKENMLLDPDCGLRKVDIPIAKEKLRILSDLAKEFN